jgi:hypothetical protein
MRARNLFHRRDVVTDQRSNMPWKQNFGWK